MPSKQTQRKQIKSREYNKTISSKAKNAIRDAKKAISEDPSSESTLLSVKKAIQSLDKATQKGVIHKNNSGRKKSRIMTIFNESLKK
jgi:small subunit ribosomal protein S20|tara:strand:+ start:40 stop:300 length:261 start_codon:yes stop_codon:yes gene_type:complete